MAKVILDSTDTQYVIANNNVEVKGASGDQTIVVNSGVTGLSLDSTIEDVDFAGNVADFTFSQDGAGNLTVLDSSGNAIATVSGANGKTLSFADGTVVLETTFDATTGTGGINLGGTAVGTTAAAVVPATIDATDVSTSTGSGSTPTTGETFALTTGTDTKSGTSGDDTITAASGTLNSEDVILDSSSDDNDVLNVDYVASDFTSTPTVAGIENINVNIDTFDGTATTFDAENVTGATITLDSDKLGFNGTAGIKNTAENAVVAGSAVSNLTVDGLGSANVDLGVATTVKVTTDSALTTTANLTVNSDVESLEIATATTLDLDVTAASTVIFATGGGAGGSITKMDVSGEDLILRGKAAELTALEVTNSGAGSLGVRVDDAAALDVSKYELDTLQLVTAYDKEAKVNAGVAVSALGTLGTGATLTNGSSLKSGQVGSTIDLALGGAVTDLGIKSFQNANLTLNGETTVGAVTFTPGTMITGDTTLAFDGSGDLTLTTTGGTDVNTVDASALDGDLTYNSGTLDQTVLGAQGANSLTTGATGTVSYTGQDGGDTIKAATAGGTLSVQTGSGNDTLTATALAGGRLLATLGAGDDTLTVEAAVDTSTGGQFIFDGGEGDDTLVIENGAILNKTATGSDVSNVETILLKETATNGGADVTLGSYVLSGNTVTLEGAYAKGETTTTNDFNVKVDDSAATTGKTIDLSGVTFNALKAVEKMEVLGSAKADTITGPNVAATKEAYIKTDKGDDSVVLGSGSGVTYVDINEGVNTIDLSNASASNVLILSANVDSTNVITGWKSQTKINVADVAGAGLISAEANINVGDKDGETLADATAYVINTTGVAANLSLSGTATMTDFTSANQMANYLNERIDDTDASAFKNVFIVNDTTSDSDMSYIWTFDGSAGAVNGDIEAAELQLVATVDNGGSDLNTATNIELTAAGAGTIDNYTFIV